jgi:hypothetical protein
MKAEIWVSIYAAVVGTSAFFLNLKSWRDSGVKLSLNLISDGISIGRGPDLDEWNLVILTVTNRGGASTVITNMILFEFQSPLQQWRMRPSKSYIIPNPQLKGYPPNVPSDLESSKRWTGAIRKRDDLGVNLRDGRHYTGVYASNRNRPYLIRIPKEKAANLPEGTKPFGS